MWDFEARDDHRDAAGRKSLRNTPTHLLCHDHQVACQIGIEVDPVVDLDDRDYQGVAGRQRFDREKRDTPIVPVDEPSRQLAVDDAAEQRRHVTPDSGVSRESNGSLRRMARRFFLRSVVLGDALALVVAILLATNRVFDVWMPWLVSTTSGSLMPSVVLLIVGASMAVYAAFLSWGHTAPRPSYGRALAIVASTMAFTSLGLVISRSYWSREWLLSVAFFWFVLAILLRFLLRRRPWSESMVVITAEKVLADDLGNSPHAEVEAIVDPLGDPAEAPLIDDASLVVDLRAVLSEDMARYVSSASVSGQRVRPLVEVYEEHTGRLPLVHILGGWELTRPVQRSEYAGVKRVIDVVFVALTVPLWIALWGIVWLAVRLDSPGPAIYRQQRVGRNGEPFTLIKFRTMVIDAEKNGPQFASEDDPRITRIGRLLRKSRLDEIPQLWNVLVGDLALVGPRPERPVFVEEFSRSIPFYDSRHLIRPGVTGWAQVHYGYADGEADTVEKLTYDLYYVKYSSLWLDIHILGQSIWTVLTGFGAR